MRSPSPGADQAVELIAQALPTLNHPGDGKPFALPLPMFRPQTLPPEVAAKFASDAGLPSPNIARLVAEALVAHLEANGHTIITKNELDTMQQSAADKAGKQVPRVHCHCGAFLFSLGLDTDKPVVNGPQFIRAIAAIPPDCNDHRQ